MKSDGHRRTGSPTGQRGWSIFRIGAILLVAVIGLTCASVPLIGSQIAEDHAAAAASAQMALQRATDALADKTRTLFGSLDSLVRLSSLVVDMETCCDATAQSVARHSLQEGMHQSPLGLHALKLVSPQGHELLSLGTEPVGAPQETVWRLGAGLPWGLRNGHQALHFVRSLPSNPGYLICMTIDLGVLANAAEVAAPTGTETALYRLSDGALLTALSHDDRHSLAEAADAVRFIDSPTLLRFDTSDRGLLTPSEALGGQGQAEVAFVTLHELGLVVTAKIGGDELLAASDLHARTLRLIPWFVLVTGLLISAAILIAIVRRRARAELEDGQRVSAAEAAGRAELEHLVGCSPAMLYRGRLTPNGDFVREYLSPNTREVTGWASAVLDDPEEVWALAPDEDRRLRDKNYVRAAKEGRSAVEYRFQRPDGGFSWLRNEAMVVRRLPDGSVELAGAITNISREREISAYAAMQNRLASLGEIAASLAHELTQPMTVIGIAAALAQNSVRNLPESADLMRQLDAIAAQSDRASDIIRHLRLYGRADGGPLANIQLRQAAQGALSLAGMALREADVEIIIEISEDLPAVRARLVQIEQILVNLLINARDAMSANPPGARRVTMRAGVTGGRVQLQVEDTGPGVPNSLIERLFEPFYTTKAPGEGTGLGLSLCQTMMRQFGGNISAANGRYGAIFTLDFPMQTAVMDPTISVSTDG